VIGVRILEFADLSRGVAAHGHWRELPRIGANRVELLSRRTDRGRGDEMSL
jgi:hypothetical protein